MSRKEARRWGHPAPSPRPSVRAGQHLTICRTGASRELTSATGQSTIRSSAIGGGCTLYPPQLPSTPERSAFEDHTQIPGGGRVGPHRAVAPPQVKHDLCLVRTFRHFHHLFLSTHGWSCHSLAVDGCTKDPSWPREHIAAHSEHFEHARALHSKPTDSKYM